MSDTTSTENKALNLAKLILELINYDKFAVLQTTEARELSERLIAYRDSEEGYKELKSISYSLKPEQENFLRTRFLSDLWLCVGLNDVLVELIFVGDDGCAVLSVRCLDHHSLDTSAFLDPPNVRPTTKTASNYGDASYSAADTSFELSTEYCRATVRPLLRNLLHGLTWQVADHNTVVEIAQHALRDKAVQRLLQPDLKPETDPSKMFDYLTRVEVYNRFNVVCNTDLATKIEEHKSTFIYSDEWNRIDLIPAGNSNWIVYFTNNYKRQKDIFKDPRSLLTEFVKNH